MTHLSRVRSALSGFPGGPGVATMYFLDTATAVASVHDFWTTVAGGLPTDVLVIVEPSGDVIEDTTGEIVDAWGAAPVATIPGTSTGKYAAPAGGLVSWETSTILDGRRLRGRTFVVPISSDFFQTNGSLDVAIGTALSNAAAQLIIEQSDSMVVWHRPFAGRAATATKPAKAAHDGGHGLVTGHRVPDRVSVLRSRRD